MKKDKGLVAAALKEGAEAFGPIVEKYKDAVYGVALARLKNYHDAEDVAQTVFVDAFGKLERLRDADKLGSWLRSIAINKSIDLMRRRKEAAGIGEGADGKRSMAEWQEKEKRRELKDEVMAAIAKLSKPQQETTTLFYVNGYSVEEVAKMQEVPVGTVKGRLHDSREKLKEEMIGMVEKVLKDKAPKKDFGDKVFKLIGGFGYDAQDWHKTVAELKKIGPDGVDGFIRALESGEPRMRKSAVHMLGATGITSARIAELLIEALKDKNRKVRRFTLEVLINGDHKIGEKQKKQLLPVFLEMLHDKSRKVRQAVCWNLSHSDYAKQVPLEFVAKELAEEREKHTLQAKLNLLRAVLEAKKKPVKTKK